MHPGSQTIARGASMANPKNLSFVYPSKISCLNKIKKIDIAYNMCTMAVTFAKLIAKFAFFKN